MFLVDLALVKEVAYDVHKLGLVLTRVKYKAEKVQVGFAGGEVAQVTIGDKRTITSDGGESQIVPAVNSDAHQQMQSQLIVAAVVCRSDVIEDDVEHDSKVV